MPAMHYTVRWPDASTSVCYSPSLVIQDYFEVEADYPMPDFLSRVRSATAIANERVQAKFGFTCSRAAEQLDLIERRAASYGEAPGALVRMLAFGPATS